MDFYDFSLCGFISLSTITPKSHGAAVILESDVFAGQPHVTTTSKEPGHIETKTMSYHQLK